MSDCFQYQIHITVFNINFNVFSQTWVIAFLANRLFGFTDFKITCIKAGIVLANQLKKIDQLRVNNF